MLIYTVLATQTYEYLLWIFNKLSLGNNVSSDLLCLLKILNESVSQQEVIATCCNASVMTGAFFYFGRNFYEKTFVTVAVHNHCAYGVFNCIGRQ